MTESEKIQKLSTFCNNLGKSFRKLVETTEKSDEKFKNEISSLKKTNAKLEKEIEVHKKELLCFKELANSMQEEVRLMREKYEDTLNKRKDDGYTDGELAAIECQATSEDIKNIKNEIYSVDTKLMEIEKDLKDLKNEELYLRKKVRKHSIHCDHCDMTLDNLSALEQHVKNEHVSSTFKCGECDFVFYSKLRLQKHIKSHGKEIRRHCHYFNSNKKCPFEELGCKFLHIVSSECKYGNLCRSHMCQFKH